MIPSPPFLRRALALVLCFTAALAAVAAEPVRSFDVPPGDAAQTLKQFAAQAGREIVFSPANVAGVQTRAVQGEFAPRAALDLMLEGSGLVAREDNKTGAFAVRAAAESEAKNDPSRPAGSPAARTEDGVIRLQDFLVEGVRAPGPVNEGVIPRVENRAVPFQIFDRTAIENSGASSLGEFFRSYSGNTATGLGFQTAFGGSTNLLSGPGDSADRINLRGLGNNRTIVLLNGRRLYGSDSLGPDVSRIPLNAVERVEILSGAAAAIYGANAVGGAVNIITRRHYNVNELTLYAGIATQGGAEEWRGTLYSSFSLNHGRTSGSIILEHTDRGDLRASEREFYLDAVAAVPTSSPVYRTVLSNLLRTPRALISTTAPSGLLLPSNPSAATAVVPAGYAGTNPAANDFNSTAGQLPLGFRRAGAVLLQPAMTIDSVNFQGEHSLIQDRLDAYTELAWRYQKVATTYPGIIGGVNLAATHPLNPFRANPSAGRPTGVAISVLWDPIDMPSDEAETRQRTVRLVGGLKGKLGAAKKWAWALDYSYDRNEANSLNVQRTGALNDAVALGVYNPFRDLAVHPNTVNVEDITARIATRNVPEIYVGNLRVSGELHEWRAGRIGLSFGAESREEKIHTENAQSVAPVRLQNNPASAALIATLNGSTDSSRQARSAYAELTLPVFGRDFRFPLLEELEFSFAVRRESYGNYSYRSSLGNGGASTFDPGNISDTPITAAVLWKPVRDVAFRASYADTFVSPTMTQFFSARNTRAGTIASTFFDPVLNRTVTLPAGTYDVTSGGNGSLLPESGRSYNYGVILTPRWLPGLTLNADLFHLVSYNQIRTPSVQTIVSYFPGRVTRDSANNVIAYDVSVVNMSQVVVGGADLRAQWQHTFRQLGTLSWQVGATYTDYYKQQPVIGNPFLYGVGDRTLDPGAPLRWKGSSSLTLTRGAWTAGITARHTGTFKDAFNTGLAVPNTNGGIDGDHIRSQTEFDVRASYEFEPAGSGWRRLLKDSRVTVGVLNALDRRPPYLSTNAGAPYYSYYNDPRMRFVYLEFRKRL